MKWRLPVLLLLLGITLSGATLRLYLKDGSYQLVREYQVLPDRVKYLSAERGEWEEIPLDLVDLNHTKQEVAEHEDQLRQEEKTQAEEDAAIKEQKLEATYVPDEPGGYYVRGDKLDALKQADVTMITDKKRTVLKILSPIPLVPGKGSVEIEGAASKFRVEGDRPEFYFRLDGVNGFGIFKLTSKKTARVVETVSVAAVTNELTDQHNTVATFTKQAGEQLFKIWPEKPLEPGEYALIEYAEDKAHLQVWDFGVGPPK